MVSLSRIETPPLDAIGVSGLKVQDYFKSPLLINAM
jgi:hypothetical protein